jgi:hypothetical protein
MNHQAAAVRFGMDLAAVWHLAAGAAAGEPPRSHLQPAGELSAAEPADNEFGLRLERTSAVLRQQLALKRGAGLVVAEVLPQSRASRAGFAQYDVLVKLDDQLLLLPEQFAALVESAERDGPLECTVLRGGREVVIPLAGVPRRTGPVAGPLRPTPTALKAATPSAFGDRNGARAADGMRRVAAETLLRQDADYQIRLTGGDETQLVVSEPSGRVVFNAAIDTPEARSRMPVAVRARVEEMERLLETAPRRPPAAERPAAEIGRLEVAPVEIR